jgi:hypothetical protein
MPALSKRAALDIAESWPGALTTNAYYELMLDMDAYAEKYGNKAVRKNLTIPAWLATYAEAKNVNFSEVLRDSLTAMYQAENPAS